METYSDQGPEKPFWPTFYRSFLKDVSRVTPQVNEFSEMANLRSLERAVGNRLYFAVFPTMGKAIENSFIQLVPLKVPSEIAIRADSEGYPYFLNYFFRRLFYSKRGVLFPRIDYRDFSAENEEFAFLVLRQAFSAFSKVTDIEPECNPIDELNEFVDRITQPLPIKAEGSFLQRVRKIISLVFGSEEESYTNADPMELCAPLAQWEEIPFGSHGPGAVANGEQGREKWDFRFIDGIGEELYHYFPASYRQQFFSADGLRKLLESVRVINSERNQERVSRLAVVPKDFRGHRLICIEPKELQFAQQGLMCVLYKHIHSHFLTRRSIDFLNQMPSQRLCRSKHYATIDLKDASDHLSIALARLILPKRLFRLLTRYRSDYVDVDGIRHVKNRAFATMGSALCFPVETIVFFAITLASVMEMEGVLTSSILDPIYWDHFQRGHRLRVFGDDIVVHRRYADHVVKRLEDCGFVVNKGKTCIDSIVRESCGSYWFNNKDVRVVRFKTTRLRSTADWLGVSTQAKELADAGWRHTAQAVLDECAQMHPIPFGKLGYPARIPCRDRMLKSKTKSKTLPTSYLFSRDKGFRWNAINDDSSRYQRLEFRTPAFVQRVRFLPGVDGLYAYFTDSATKTLAPREHPIDVEWCWIDVN